MIKRGHTDLSPTTAITVAARIAFALTGAALVFAWSPPPGQAAFSGANGRIVFEDFVGGGDISDSTIYTVTPAGTRARQVADGGEPACSPDGRWIAYTPEEGGGIRIIRASGRARTRRLTQGPDFNADWSPNGGRLVFARGPELRIYHRGRSRRLTDGGDPAWSTRNRILFFRSDGLYVIRPDGTGLRRLSAARGVRSVDGIPEGDWSPDGRRIVVETGGGNIATMRADGSGFRRLTRSGEYSSPSYSPDGRMIVFGVGEYLAVMNANGARRRILRGVAEVAATDWQPLPRRRR